MRKTARVLDIIEIFAGICCLFYYGLCSVQMNVNAVMLYLWIVIGLIMIASGVYGHFVQHGKEKWKLFRGISYGFHVIILIGFLGYVTFCCFVFRDIRDYTEEDCDYLFVLGAGVNGTQPSPVLQRRINAAYEYLVTHDDTMVVGTGGKGVGAQISEGGCIAETLESMGINKDSIIIEDESTTTAENMEYALKVIAQQSQPIKNPQQIIVVSDGYHLFRAKLLLAHDTDASIHGIAASGMSFMTPHYVLREYCVFLVDLFHGKY